MVCDKGINDMPRGWRIENEWNYRVYHVWKHMIQRCSEEYYKKYPTYKGCYCCERWLKLSNFIEDIVKIDGYEYWLSNPSNKMISLDKDIKSDGQNKCYCLEQCQFVDQSENARQSTRTRDNSYLKERKNSNHPMYNKHHKEETRKKMSEAHKGKPKGQLIARYDLDMNLIDIKYRFEYAQMGFNQTCISECCNNKQKTHKGFIFKYYKKND